MDNASTTQTNSMAAMPVVQSDPSAGVVAAQQDIAPISVPSAQPIQPVPEVQQVSKVQEVASTKALEHTDSVPVTDPVQIQPHLPAKDASQNDNSTQNPAPAQVRHGGTSIDLLPELSTEQVQKIEKKGKTNVFGILLVLSVVGITVIILILNLLTRTDYNRKQKQLTEEKNNIVSLQYVEVKQKALVTKVNAYTAVREFDFSPDVVLTYLLEVTSGLSEVQMLNLNENLEFTISGSADSYINVARLWHDMSTQNDYFEEVHLNSVSMTDTEDGNKRVTFTFSGKINRDNVDNIN